MHVDVGSFFNCDNKRNPKVEVYIKNVRRKLKLFPFSPERKDLLSEDGIRRAATFEMRRPHVKTTFSRSWPNRKLFHRREHDMIDMEDPEILDIMRKSTIPPSLSLRAPPANIALGGRREKVIGITNVDASERYINKLQKDRDRNNQALYRALDNLPIKIKQMRNADGTSFTDMDLAREHALYKSRQPDFNKQEAPMKKYDLNRNCRSLGSLPSPKSSKSQSTVQSKFSTKSSVFNRFSHRRPVRKKFLDALDPRIFGFQYDFDSMENSINISTYNKIAHPYVPKPGFNGYPIKGKLNSKTPRKTQTVPVHSTNGETMPLKYSKTEDFDRFVYSSLAVSSKANVNKPLPPILSEKRHKKESTDFFAISSVQKYNDPDTHQTELKKDRIPDKYRNARYQESPGIGPLVPMHSFNSGTPMSKASPRKAGPNTGPKSDASSTKSGSRCNSVDDDHLKVSVSKSVLKSREGLGKNSASESEAGDSGNEDEVDIQPLSESTLKQHLNKDKSGKQLNEACNLTYISEREDSNLTMTTQSEQLQQMKILIYYKNNEVDDIKERSEVSDSFAVPAWVSDAETDKEDIETREIIHDDDNKNRMNKSKQRYKNDANTKIVSSNKVDSQEDINIEHELEYENRANKNNSEIIENGTIVTSTAKMNDVNEHHGKGRSRTNLPSDDNNKSSPVLVYSNKSIENSGNRRESFEEKVESVPQLDKMKQDSLKLESLNNSSENFQNENTKNTSDLKENSNENFSRNENTKNTGETRNDVKHSPDGAFVEVDESGTGVYLTAHTDDKPRYSFQSHNAKNETSETSAKIGYENLHNISVIPKSVTNAELQIENRNDRSNTNLV